MNQAHIALLDRLIRTGGIEIRRGQLFDLEPGLKPQDFDFGRIEGMMLALAVGDALGNPTESRHPFQRREAFGEIRDYVVHPYTGTAMGLPSDDTQLAFWTIEQMLEDDGFEPERLAAKFCSGRIYGIGGSVREFVARFKSGTPWEQCGPESAGNGALMRIAPMLIPHLRTGQRDLWADTALSAMITHNDSASISACLAFVFMLWQLLDMDRPPSSDWWLKTYVDVARELETGENYVSRAGGNRYEGPMWAFVEREVGRAWADGLDVLTACEGWRSGAFLLETVPSVLYILMRYEADAEEARAAALVPERLHRSRCLPQRPSRRQMRDQMLGRCLPLG
ncbi:MAG: ADP-ribosylglycohydrolase family protein [Phycisphaerae bacterium]|nr:ADP-ribosylglycohydrolase family protein [Phycisphaerae bacterium]